jgi:hypothetical protein
MQLAEIYGVNSISFGVEPKRYVRIMPRRPGSAAAKLAKSESAAGSGSGAVNGTPGGAIGSGAAPSLTSSIGTYLSPGVLILPALSLKEAVDVRSSNISLFATSLHVYCRLMPPGWSAFRAGNPAQALVPDCLLRRALALVAQSCLQHLGGLGEAIVRPAWCRPSIPWSR